MQLNVMDGQRRRATVTLNQRTIVPFARTLKTALRPLRPPVAGVRPKYRFHDESPIHSHLFQRWRRRWFFRE